MLKLISLNVERSKHLSRIIPFIQSEQPDILSFQEVFEADLTRFSEGLGFPHVVYLRDGFIEDNSNAGSQPNFSGIALFSRFPLHSTGSQYYYMPEGGIALEAKAMIDARATNAQGVIWGSIEKDGEVFTLANTHFTWTPDGHPNDLQEKDFQALKEILMKLSPHVLVGDLNAPRGRGMWEKFQALYVADNIPAHVVTTIDQEWHKKKGLQFVVDALFSMPEYQVKNVRIVPGVSDHQAIVAELGRRIL